MTTFRESYTHWWVTDDTVFISMVRGTQYMYLLEGEEQALLIDTGWGRGKLTEYIHQLTDRPVLVVNTHGHLDHAGGNAWWPEVHMHRDAARVLTTSPPMPAQFEFPHPDYNKVFVEEGFFFDLGGREVEVIEISAHSPGSLALLDRATGMLFTGDEVESGQVLLFDHDRGGLAAAKEKAKRHLANMLKLKGRSEEFRFICPSHNGAPISPSYIDDFIALDLALLEDQVQTTATLRHWYISRLPFAHELRRATLGKASVIFRV